MKILHENGKLFGKISMIDIVVVFLIIFLICSVINRYFNDIIPKNNENTINTSQIEFYYDVEIKNVIPEVVDMVQIGDKVYDKTSGTEIGEVVQVSYNEANLDFMTNDGRIIKSELDEKRDINVKVKSKGNIQEGKYKANYTIDILAGENRQFETKYVSFYANIIDVYVMGE